MTALLSAAFLIAGALLCVVAAVGVLRLPDYFMRMHAATKAGVAGSGLVLIGVGFAEPSIEMWAKIVIGISFLLLTTPLAGHLLGRAGYVAGVPLWVGTATDELSRELERGQFDRPVLSSGEPPIRGSHPLVRRIVFGLASGPNAHAAIEHAVALAKARGLELIALAIVDTKMLMNVGPVPVGGNYWADKLRSSQIGKARHALAEAVQLFEGAASEAGIRFGVHVEEGDPVRIFRKWQREDTVLAVGRGNWFDQGASGRDIDPIARLTRAGIGPVVSLPPGSV